MPGRRDTASSVPRLEHASTMPRYLGSKNRATVGVCKLYATIVEMCKFRAVVGVCNSCATRAKPRGRCKNCANHPCASSMPPVFNKSTLANCCGDKRLASPGNLSAREKSKLLLIMVSLSNFSGDYWGWYPISTKKSTGYKGSRGWPKE